MMEFLQDILRYILAVLTSWKVLAGTLIGWLLFSVVTRFKAFGTRTILLWLGIFLVAAPFRVWREQEQQITQLDRAQTTATTERDSLRVALTASRATQPIRANEDTYRAVRVRLVFFVRQADSLAMKYAKAPAGPSDAELPAWTERVRRYLRTSAPDPSYEVEFNSATEPDDEHTYYGGSQAPIALTKRRAVLLKFLEQLRRTS